MLIELRQLDRLGFAAMSERTPNQRGSSSHQSSSDRSRLDAITDGTERLPINETMGFELQKAADPKSAVTLTWVVPREYCNTAGNVQGGILAAFADSVLGAAVSAHLPEDRYPALAEMKISIFRPAPEGSKLTGTGRVVKPGKRLLFSEAEVTDADGRLIAKASGTAVPADA